MPTEARLRRARLHPVQRQVTREARRFNVVCCGRRWGKTKLGVNLLIEPVLAGRPVGWFAPTYKVLDDAWEQLKALFGPVTLHKDETAYSLRTLTGGLVEMWSLEGAHKEDAGRSRRYARVVIDEAAMVAGLDDVWQASIRPTLADFRGDAFFCSTPKGENFFKTAWLWGKDETRRDWMSWQFPTATNPHIHPDEIEAARLELPDRIFAQEWLAEFVPNQEGVFRGVREAATLARRRPYSGTFVMGLDWAQVSDYTVVTVMDATTRRMVDMDRFHRLDWALMRGRVVTMCEKWRPTLVVAEANSIGGPNIEALMREGLPLMAFDTTATSKPPLIESLALAFERGEIEILDDQVLVGELEAYERTVSPVTGRSRYSAPEGQHDDTVMSLALAWHGVMSGAQRSRTRRVA